MTTDHISPAGSIAPGSPAGRWLQEHGVGPLDFNSYGARRGHHEVMMRGTFANIRLRNALRGRPGRPDHVHLPDGAEGTIYDVAMRYRAEGTPLLVIAGKEYGSGSSRDWAAKGPMLLGVRAVLAESFERIHRANLVGMGVLPLQFVPGESAASLGLTGRESYAIHGLAEVGPRASLHGRRPGRRRHRATVRGDRPARRRHRRRLLPARRDPAGGPAPARRRLTGQTNGDGVGGVRYVATPWPSGVLPAYLYTDVAWTPAAHASAQVPWKAVRSTPSCPGTVNR